MTSRLLTWTWWLFFGNSHSYVCHRVLNINTWYYLVHWHFALLTLFLTSNLAICVFNASKIVFELLPYTILHFKTNGSIKTLKIILFSLKFPAARNLPRWKEMEFLHDFFAPTCITPTLHHFPPFDNNKTCIYMPHQFRSSSKNKGLVPKFHN